MREQIRPTIYRVMKYWGKKPHNIWRKYIEKYSNRGNLVLDPFVGSGMTYFEAIKSGRIPLTIDLNPLSDFSIKCLTNRNVDIDLLKNSANNIIKKIKGSDFYINEYTTICKHCGSTVVIYNYKKNGKSTITYKCQVCNEIFTEEWKYTEGNYIIDKWIPNKKLTDIESISSTFLKKIGSNSISSLWTNRNLKILSEIYDLILKEQNENVKMMLVFGFIQSLHLTSKMCVPRNEKSKRPLSTSWGRPAYMLSSKIFEQNPLIAFEKAIFNGTGVIKGLNSSIDYIGENIQNIGNHYLGSANEVLKNLEDNSVDLIITDPPYGNIIQYGDLSEVWVSWLEKYNSKYKIEHKKEIIKNKNKDNFFYKKELHKVFVELNRVLKENGKFVLTFNSNLKSDWDSLFYALKESGFCINEIVYQKNKRSSEANVSAKSGIAISDYYFICTKGIWNTNIIEKFYLKWEKLK